MKTPCDSYAKQYESVLDLYKLHPEVCCLYYPFKQQIIFAIIIIIGPIFQCLNSAIQQVNHSQVDAYFQELHL